jgi:ornithine cyclodeaminase/alanine dehydrogenase-like protein (mu-crystallin family)
MLAISRDDLKQLVSMRQCIDLVKAAFVELYQDRAVVPLRLGLDVDPGKDVTLLMPAYMPRLGALGFKVVSVFQSNSLRELPVTSAMVSMVDAETGVPDAILNGTYLTQLRTGAVSGAGAELMSRENSRNLAVIGGGAQGVTQAVGIASVRDIETITVVDRFEASFPRFQAAIEKDWPDLVAKVSFTQDAEEPVRNADIVCLATTSVEPVFDASWIKPGTHISGVGSFTPEMQETPEAFVVNARIVVDMKEHALAETGDLIIPLGKGTLKESDIVGELGGLVLGEFQGRTSEEENTFFKSVGNAVQDMAVGRFAVQQAIKRGIGQQIDLG